jgi:acyl carrier protein
VSNHKDDSEIVEMIRSSMLSVVKDLRVDPTSLNMSSTLASLGIDSINAIEMGADLEERLGIRLPDDQLARMASIRDLVLLIQKNLKLAA